MIKFNTFKLESGTGTRSCCCLAWLGLRGRDANDLFCFERVLSRFIPVLIECKPVLFIVLPSRFKLTHTVAQHYVLINLIQMN